MGRKERKLILNISEKQIERAKELYSFKNIKGSITKGESNIYGAIGEIIIQDLFVEKGFNVDNKSTYDYDLIINDLKVDVKTKHTTVIPQMHYNCSIAAFNIKQKCDYYFFLRVTKDLKKCYLLGYISKNNFFEKCVFNKQNDIDINGWKFKSDCYNLPISMLYPFFNGR